MSRGGKREGAGRPPLGDAPTVPLGVRVPLSLRARVLAAAEARGMTKAAWVRAVLLAALGD